MEYKKRECFLVEKVLCHKLCRIKSEVDQPAIKWWCFKLENKYALSFICDVFPGKYESQYYNFYQTQEVLRTKIEQQEKKSC